jgi:hypothetical protein
MPPPVVWDLTGEEIEEFIRDINRRRLDERRKRREQNRRGRATRNPTRRRR